MLISIAIPCYRSAKNLPSVVAEIKEEFSKHPEHDYQLVLVNDGSPDNTFEIIRELCKEDEKIVGVNLSRNYTQANAKMAALPYVKGDVVVYMDDDGQHPAEGIFKLVDKISEGYDVVYAHFTHKKTSKFKIITSDLNVKILVALGVRPKGIKTSAFMAISKFVAKNLLDYHSPSPSGESYMLRLTTKFANVEMDQRERLHGKSGYNLKKLIALAVQGYTNFTIVPLRIANYCGLVSSFAGILFGLFIFIRKLIRPDIAVGYTSIMATLLFIGGILMIMLGLLGEYVGRIYMLLSNTPQYTVREELNNNNENNKKDNEE